MKRIENTFNQFNIDDFAVKEPKYRAYMDEILERNKYINLTAIKDEDEFIQKHYVDSLLCAGSEEFISAKRILDLGTGGGFPGVPLAIAFPDKEFILMDSLNKRIKIINELCAQIGIHNVTAVHGRAEEMARKPEYRENFDTCVSRAVANMSTLSEYCLPFVRVGGSLIAYKGPDSEAEIDSAAKAIEILGGKLRSVVEVKSDDFDYNHRLVYISKVKSTPKKYPRKSGIPSKEPIL